MSNPSYQQKERKNVEHQDKNSQEIEAWINSYAEDRTTCYQAICYASDQLGSTGAEDSQQRRLSNVQAPHRAYRRNVHDIQTNGWLF